MTEGAAAIRVEAPAKVNLYLHVVGRRSDGYHLLDSLVVFPAIGDRIEVEPADALSLTVTGPFAAAVPADDDNLVLRAARMLASAADPTQGAHIRLIKRLPAASGIGGGSADAAATLRALKRLWQIDPAAVDLERVALALGADVPMCLAGRTVFVSGIGERLSQAPPLPPFALLLANPGVGVSTPAVFAARKGPFSHAAPFAETPPDVASLARLLAARDNDLGVAAEALAPEIGRVRAALAATPGALLARMSGSGATCFALYAARDQAEAARSLLAARYPGWWLAAAPVAAPWQNDWSSLRLDGRR